MPTNNLAPKTKNYLSPIPPKMSERFGSAVLPYLQSVQGLFPPTNPYGQATSNFLLGQAPQAAQRMAEGYPNVLFDTRNLLGGNRIVNPVALDMAVALPIGTALKGAGLAGGGVAATFAGIGAKTANREALAIAERMKAAGVADEEIHKATGWFFGSADGKPRFEIPDDAARLNAGALRDFHNNTSLVRQSRLMQHPELSAAYPDTGNIPYRKHNNPGASYDPAEDAINIPQGSGHPDMSQELRDTAVKSPALHELQHAIQQREGFARGGSPKIGDSSYAKELAQKVNAKYSPEIDRLGKLKDWEAVAKLDDLRRSEVDAIFSADKAGGDFGGMLEYRHLAGEAEARLTQSRMDMTGAERAASYPPGMYDVPVGDQIVRYGDGPAMSVQQRGSIGNQEKNIYADDDGRPVKFYHGGRTPFTGIRSGGRFGEAIFAREGKPSGYGTHEQEMYIRGPILNLDELKDKLNEKTGRQKLSAAVGKKLNDDKADRLIEALTDESNYPTDSDVWKIIGAIDESDAQIEIQKLRGKVSRSFGYDAVRTPDEFDGETIMVLDNAAIILDAPRAKAAPVAPLIGEQQSPESQAIARYREIKGPKSVVRMEAALRTAGVPLPKNEPVAYIQRLVDQAHRRN